MDLWSRFKSSSHPAHGPNDVVGYCWVVNEDKYLHVVRSGPSAGHVQPGGDEYPRGKSTLPRKRNYKVTAKNEAHMKTNESLVMMP